MCSLTHKVLDERVFDAAGKDGILVKIGNDGNVLQIPLENGECLVKRDVLLDKLTLHMESKGWTAVLSDSIVKITELWMKTTTRLMPYVGAVEDTVITKIAFEVVPDDSKMIFNA